MQKRQQQKRPGKVDRDRGDGEDELGGRKVASASAAAQEVALAEAEDAVTATRHAWRALDTYFAADPYLLTRHHLDSYDRFLDRGIADVIRNMTPISLLKEDVAPPGGAGGGKKRTVLVEVLLGSREVRVDTPTIVGDDDGLARPLLPNEARLLDLTYATNVYVDVLAKYTVTSEGATTVRTVALPRPVCLGSVPLMLHSRHCLLRGLPPDALRAAGECPYDRGGYFVVDGKEKIIVAKESPVKNRLYVRPGESSRPEVAFLAFIACESPKDSFPRSTTFYLRSRLAPTGKGVVRVVVQHLGEVRSTGSAGAKADLTGAARAAGKATRDAPLFVLFRALGVESDRAILRLVLGHDPVTSSNTASASSEGASASAADAAIVELLRPSLLEAAAMGVTDQRTALAWLGRFVPPTMTLKQVLSDDLFPNVGTGFAAKARFLGHAVGRIARAALPGGEDAMAASQRDDYANKRLAVSGFMLEDLFRDVYLRVRGGFVRRLDGEWHSGAWRTTGDVERLVDASNAAALFETGMLTERLRKSMKGDWGTGDDAGDAAAEERDGTGGLVQDLSRVSYLTYVSHARRVSSDTDKSIKLAEPHLLRASHWGAVCPVESPDGPNIGLLNHLATTARISMGLDAEADRAVRDAVLSADGTTALGDLGDIDANPDGTEETNESPGKEGQPSNSCKVFVNDTWLAVTSDPPTLARKLRALRRAGELHPDVSVAWRIFDGELHVHTDRGRFLRPLAIVEGAEDGTEGASMPKLPLPFWDLTTQSLEKVGSKNTKDLGPRSIPTVGVAPTVGIEEVDIEEARTLLVAMRPSDVARSIRAGGSGERYTHCELHPSAAMLSVLANTYPMLNHNHGPYNVLSLAQFKQAIGTYSSAFLSRMDTVGCVLHHPQRPLVSTTFADRLCCDGQLAHGENLVVAVLSYTGYNMEDAILLNRDSVDRGRFHLTCYETHRYEEAAGEEGGEGDVVFANPLETLATAGNAAGTAGTSGTILGANSYAGLERDGTPRLDRWVGEGRVLLGRVVRKTSKASQASRASREGAEGPGGPVGADIDRSVAAGGKRTGVVDRVAVFRSPPRAFGGGGTAGGHAPRTCKIRLRELRSPELGDKLASRFGQKGVVGMLLPARDMPFVTGDPGSRMAGTVPDLIINPHGMPKRMTVTHLLECLLGKAAASGGARYNANSFEGGDPLGVASAALVRAGLAESGVETLCNGRTGEQIGCSVFVGINYYGRLKHMVADKVQTRCRGPVNAMTRQPTKTDGGSGGLRIGEMEKDAVLAHGMAGFLKEAFLDRSDRRRAVVDADEGTHMIGLDPPRALPDGGLDGGPPAVATVETPHAFLLLQQELATMAVGTLLRPGRPRGDPAALPGRDHERVDDDADEVYGGHGGSSDDDEGSDAEEAEDAEEDADAEEEPEGADDGAEEESGAQADDGDGAGGTGM